MKTKEKYIKKITQNMVSELGIWYICDGCKSKVFIPGNRSNHYLFCPYCGGDIGEYDGMGFCKDDDTISDVNYNKL